MDGTFVIYVLTYMAERGYMRKFQVIQEEDGSITVNVVPEPGVFLSEHQADLNFIVDKIQFVMGKDCPVRFCTVHDIPGTDAGKYLYSICRKRAQSLGPPRVP